MLYGVLYLLLIMTTVLDVVLFGAVALRMSMLGRERLRRAGAPDLLALTPGGGTQSYFELLLGSEHRRIGDRLLSIGVWALRVSVVLGAIAWVATWFIDP